VLKINSFLVESPALHSKPDIAMFKASQIINIAMVKKCNSLDEDCITNLVYPCQEVCPSITEVIIF